VLVPISISGTGVASPFDCAIAGDHSPDRTTRYPMSPTASSGNRILDHDIQKYPSMDRQRWDGKRIPHQFGWFFCLWPTV
jgi:hypothetical protein